ncbi:hypothetical protein NE639_26880, partial [Blautia producta]|nr:hypothetical protein [Blautia producta]
IHTVLGIALETFMCYQMLAVKSLKAESMRVDMVSQIQKQKRNSSASYTDKQNKKKSGCLLPPGVFGNIRLSIFSSSEIPFPIIRTGWYSHLGSPR